MFSSDRYVQNHTIPDGRRSRILGLPEGVAVVPVHVQVSLIVVLVGGISARHATAAAAAGRPAGRPEAAFEQRRGS